MTETQNTNNAGADQPVKKKGRRWLKVIGIIIGVIFLLILLLPVYSSWFASIITGRIQDDTGQSHSADRQVEEIGILLW